MRKYTSTKHILIAAFMSSALVACGNGTKDKSSTQVGGEKSAPVATGGVLPELKPLDLTYSNPAVDGPRLSQVGLSAFKATLMADAGNSAVSQTVSAFAKTELPINSATGWEGTATGKCSNPNGNYLIALSEDEGANPSSLHNQMDTHFDADFNDCSLKSGNSETYIDGQLSIDLALGIANIIGSPSFNIETRVAFSNLAISTNSQTFFADGSAKYLFATENGYIFTTTLAADSLQLNAGSSMNLVDFTTTQTNDTRDNSYILKGAGKYVDTATRYYVKVEIDSAKPFTGIGYGYPLSGKLRVMANSTSVIVIDVLKGSAAVYPPDGYYIRVVLPDGTINRYTWDELSKVNLSFTPAA